MNKEQMQAEILRLNELLRISSEQAIGFSEQIGEMESENRELKRNLYDANMKLARCEDALEAAQEEIIDFNNPFDAAEKALEQMNGLHINKIVTFAKECNRHVTAQLSVSVVHQTQALNVNKEALDSLKN